MVSGILNDVSQSLSVVLGYLDLVARALDHSELELARQQIVLAACAARSAAAATDDFLSGAHRSAHELVPIDVSRVVHEIAQLRVLVVDDSATLRELFVEMLRQAGCDAHAVGSTEAALARLEATTVDVVISDLSPGHGMNGWDLARTIGEYWPGVGVILASGGADDLAQDQRAACGVDAVLSKPFRGAELCDTVRRVALGHSWVSAR